MSTKDDLAIKDAASGSSAQVWHARDAKPGDRTRLMEVFNAAFHRNDKENLLDWRYNKNPHGVAWTVVAADLSDQVVGAYSYVPRRFRIDGKSVLCFQASDAMVFPQYQRKGIFRELDHLLAARAAEAGVPFGFAFCGRRSQKGFLANGWVPIGTYRTWTKVLKVTKAAADARRSDGRWKRLLLPLEAMRSRRADPQIKAAALGFRDTPVETFGNAMLKIGAGEHRILGERDPAYLTWRFLMTPRRTHAPFRITRNEEIVGYYDVELAQGGRGYLLDVRGTDPESEKAALALAIERLQLVGASVIQTTVLEGSFLDRHVRWLGFEPPREREVLPFIVRIFKDGPEAQAALDPKNWYILDGDRDAEGMI